MVKNHYKPDCGYAWIVVVGCFVINFIVAGLVRAAGVLYIALIDVYGVSREVATTPFSLRFCVRNLSDPIVGSLGQRYGIRPIVLLGGVISGLGGILSALAPDVTWITVAWGGIHGLGYGMSNLIHVIVINQYFRRYKGLALGICSTGECFGTFLLPLLLEFLLPVYDLRGTFLILAGISLNVIPAAMLLRSPEWEGKDHISFINSESVDGKISKGGVVNEGFDTTSEVCIYGHQMNNKEYQVPMITINDQIMCNAHESQLYMVGENSVIENSKKYQISSESSCNDLMTDSFTITDIYSLRESSSLRVKGHSKEKRLSYNACSSDSKRRSRGTSILSVLSCPSQVGKCKDTTNNIIPSSSNNFLDSMKDLIDESDQSLNIYSECNKSKFSEKKGFSISNSDNLISQKKIQIKPASFSEEKVSVQLNNNSYANENAEKNYSKVVENYQPNAFVKLLKTNIKPIFLVISATMAFYLFLFICVFTIIIDYAADNDVPREYGKYLIIAFSVTDLFGRMGFGIVLDKKCIALSHYAGMTVGLTGLLVFIIPLYKCFLFWTICFSLCGFIQGGVAVMFPVLVEYYMEKDEDSIALGSLNFYGGLLMFPLPRMIGYFRDTAGSYDGVFWTVGSLCIFAASLWTLEPCLFPKKRKETNATYISEIKERNVACTSNKNLNL